MKLYKLDYNDKVIEFKVIKETAKTYKYKDVTELTVKKSNLNKLTSGNIYGQVATSKEKLKSILIQAAENEIEAAKKRVKWWKELENKFVNL